MEQELEKDKKQAKEEFFKAIVESVAYEARHGKDINLRLGEAPTVYDPHAVYITGVIDSPLRWLEKRKGTINLLACYIAVSREEMGLKLFVDEHNHFYDTVAGRLILSEEYKRFGINEGKYKSGLEMSDLIRMNRTYFAEKKIALDLVSIMRNFKAKVTNDIENSDDKKGNVSQVRRQAVESNLPPSFELNIPIFKGQPKQKFTVEIDIDPDTLQATLVSPDAQDMIVETRDKLIDEVLDGIRELCPEIPIIEI